jgi:hypothetical protein
LAFAWWTEGNLQGTAMAASVLAEIQTEHISDMSQEHYCYTSLSIPFAYVNQPNVLAASKGYHYQHKCEHTGCMIWQEYREVCWTEKCNS